MTGDSCVASTPCDEQVTYQEAKDYCKTQDRRLCTESEMQQNVCCDVGCSFDCYWSWVATDTGK